MTTLKTALVDIVVVFYHKLVIWLKLQLDKVKQ